MSGILVLRVLSLFNCRQISTMSPNVQWVEHTFAIDSAELEISGGVDVFSWATSSEASSSISVVSVPFEVTGEGPTISLGLIICRPLGESPSSTPIDDLGRSDDDSAELRADLSRIISRVY